MQTRTLLLIRHGQYTQTTQPPESVDGPLTEIGIEQAHLTARALKNLPVSAMHVSTLQRATETASIIAACFPGVPVRTSDLLRECLPARPANRGLSEDWNAWLESQTARGDALVREAKQARQAYNALFKPAPVDSFELVISSGNLISYLLARAFGAPGRNWIRTRVNLCSISRVLVTSNRGANPLVESLGDVSHLPERLHLYS